jgi:hypothetical protein
MENEWAKLTKEIKDYMQGISSKILSEQEKVINITQVFKDEFFNYLKNINQQQTKINEIKNEVKQPSGEEPSLINYEDLRVCFLDYSPKEFDKHIRSIIDFNHKINADLIFEKELEHIMEIFGRYEQDLHKNLIKYEDESIYLGEVKENLTTQTKSRQGYGIFKDKDKEELFVGEFQDDNMTRGIYFKTNSIFVGDFLFQNSNYTFKGTFIEKDSKRSKFLGDINIIDDKFSGLFIFQRDENKFEIYIGTKKDNLKEGDKCLILKINSLDDYIIQLGNFSADELKKGIGDKNFVYKNGSYLISSENDSNFLNKIFCHFLNLKFQNNSFYIGECEFDEHTKQITTNDENGIIIFNNSNIYIGGFNLGKKAGKGIFILNSLNIVIDGEFINDVITSGKVFNLNSELGLKKAIFDGSWEDDSIKKGVYTYSENEFYEGEFLHEKRNGIGKYLYEDKSFYLGSWKDNMKHGEGTFTDETGKEFKAIWKENELETFPLI